MIYGQRDAPRDSENQQYYYIASGRYMLCKKLIHRQPGSWFTGSRRGAGVRGDGIRRPAGTEGGDVILIPLCPRPIRIVRITHLGRTSQHLNVEHLLLGSAWINLVRSVAELQRNILGLCSRLVQKFCFSRMRIATEWEGGLRRRGNAPFPDSAFAI